MRTITTFLTVIALVLLTPLQAQTADEIITNYFENTGGADAWGALKSTKMTAKVNAQGMEIPVEIYQTNDGKQLVKIQFQGQEITQLAFDGETMWATNFMTMQAEKSDAETTDNMKKTMKDFPSPLYNYKEKGFTVELMGDETMEGEDTFKIKLTQDPVMVDGKEVPNVSYYYFEKENFVPIAVEAEIRQGPSAGQMSKSTMSDYEEVDGLYFPFSMSQGGQPFSITEIVLNPEIDMSMFKFPETAASEDKK